MEQVIVIALGNSRGERPFASTDKGFSVKLLQIARQSKGIVRKYWRFGTDFPEKLFADYGWKAIVIQPGDEEANFGRYHQKLPPLKIPNLRRSFLIRASL